MTAPRALLLAALLGLAACSSGDEPTLGAPVTVGATDAGGDSASAASDGDGEDGVSGDGASGDGETALGTDDDGETSTSIEFVPRTDEEENALPELNLDDFDVVAPVLLDAGAEPTTALRYSATEGATWQPRMSYSSVITQQTGSDPAGTVFGLPPTEVDLTVTATDVARDGTQVTEFSYDRYLAVGDDTTDPGLLTDAQAAYDGLIGPGGELAVAGNGQLLTSQQLVSTELLPFMSDALAEFDRHTGLMFVPMPEEPIGVGAVWELVSNEDVIGTTIETVARYELVELNGDSYRVLITTSQRQAGSDSGLVSSTVTGTGEASGSLSAVGPSAVTLTTTGNQSFDGDITRTVDGSFSLQTG